MENSNNKVKNKKALAIIAIIAIVILAGLAYYFLRPVSPKDVFVSKINATVDNNSKSYNKETKAINSTISLSGNIESSNDEVKQIADIINQGKLMLNIQMDTESKKASISADVDYQNENLLNGKIFYQNGDNNFYIQVQDLFDKFFKVKVEEAEVVQGSSLTLSGKIDTKKANQIVKDTIAKNLKEEYFSKETADGMTKNTIKLNVAELRQIFVSVMTELKENENYLKCFEKPEEIKKSFEEAIKSVNEMGNNYDAYSVEISLFTKGILKDVKKLTAKVVASEKEEGTITINKVDNSNYEFNLNAKTEKNNMPVSVEALNGTVNIEKVDNDTQKYTIKVDNVPDVGKVTLNIEIKNVETTDLNNIDVSNSVEFDKMTQSDMMTLYTNLTKMKIYPYIAPFLGEI